jgi:hypothetical protein
MKKHASKTAVAASILVLAVAGCGGSSKKSNSSATSTSSAASTTSTGTTGTTPTTGTTGTTASTSGKPLTKAQYEAKLGPLLNDRVVPALRSALANGGARDPQKLGTAAGLVKEARDAMASLNPPKRVADLNQAAVNTLGALANDLTKMKDALQANDHTAYVNAAKSAVQDALKIQTIGNQLTARGY